MRCNINPTLGATLLMQSAASRSAPNLLDQMSRQPPHTAQLTEIEILKEVEAIRWLKARRIRALDEHTWDVYEALHATDYFADNDGEAPIHGSAANAARLKKLYDAVGMVSVHHVHSHEIVLTTASTATGG